MLEIYLIREHNTRAMKPKGEMCTYSRVAKLLKLGRKLFLQARRGVLHDLRQAVVRDHLNNYAAFFSEWVSELVPSLQRTPASL